MACADPQRAARAAQRLQTDRGFWRVPFRHSIDAFEALPAEAQIMRNIELGLVDIDGDREAAAKFRTDPVASLVVPLYRAIVDLTWGNLPGS